MSSSLLDYTDREDVDAVFVVMADCLDCSSVHPVARRESDPTTTAATSCPVCGSAGYRSFERSYPVGDLDE